MALENFFKGIEQGRKNFFNTQSDSMKLAETDLGLKLLNQSYVDDQYQKPSQLLADVATNNRRKSLADYDTKKGLLGLDILNKSQNDIVGAGVNKNHTNLLNSLRSGNDARLSFKESIAKLNYINQDMINQKVANETDALLNGTQALNINSQLGLKNVNRNLVGSNVSDEIVRRNALGLPVEAFQQEVNSRQNIDEMVALQQVQEKMQQEQRLKQAEAQATTNKVNALVLRSNPVSFFASKGIEIKKAADNNYIVPTDRGNAVMTKDQLISFGATQFGLVDYLKDANAIVKGTLNQSGFNTLGY